MLRGHLRRWNLFPLVEEKVFSLGSDGLGTFCDTDGIGILLLLWEKQIMLNSS